MTSEYKKRLKFADVFPVQDSQFDGYKRFFFQCPVLGRILFLAVMDPIEIRLRYEPEPVRDVSNCPVDLALLGEVVRRGRGYRSMAG